MDLAGQGDRTDAPPRARQGLDDEGYLLAVLLIGMALAAIWMSAMLPAWRHQAQRERELELIFRGEQYARAIVLYNRRFGSLPPSIDALVEQKFLRKKYKDPITGCDFVPIGIGIATTPQTGCNYRSSSQVQNSFDPANQGAQTINPGAQAGQGGQTGASGVRSVSTETSIVVYQNQQQHNLFPFDYQLFCQQMGGCGAAAGAGRGGGRGTDPGQPPGGRPGGGAGIPGGGGGRGTETPPIPAGGRGGGRGAGS